MNNKRNLMIVGTASSAGKSLMVTALCRIFLQDGYSVAPFKSQNMSLNSFITDDGLEMGRAQVVQAEACRIKPDAAMNPILLKPTGDMKSQVIIEGKVFKNFDAADYFQFKNNLKDIIVKNYNKLRNDFDIIVLEGAGSPAEINLKENDLVNMGMAEMVDAPAILVADIDRGGVFAAIAGTLLLLDEKEKKRIKGIIINKFRGDEEILKPGIEMIEALVHVPVLGVIPFLDIKIEDEDSVTERFSNNKMNGDIRIDVIKLPHISNFTDMDIFGLFDDVTINYIEDCDDIREPDIVIIPGSKNTIKDLLFLKENNLDKKIIELYKKGKVIVGICGGFQMLGKIVEDPFNMESSVKGTEGLGLFDMKTVIMKDKITGQVSGRIESENDLLKGLNGFPIEGYEIHMGESSGTDKRFCFIQKDNESEGIAKGNVFGTYIHGIFDNADFSRGFINNIRKKKGLQEIASHVSYKDFKEKEYGRLADIVRKKLNMEKVYRIVNREADISG